MGFTLSECAERLTRLLGEEDDCSDNDYLSFQTGGLPSR